MDRFQVRFHLFAVGWKSLEIVPPNVVCPGAQLQDKRAMPLIPHNAGQWRVQRRRALPLSREEMLEA